MSAFTIHLQDLATKQPVCGAEVPSWALTLRRDLVGCMKCLAAPMVTAKPKQEQPT